MEQQQQPRWPPTERQLLLAGATAGLLTFAILIGYRYGITLWDWIKLLVVPAVIAAGGLWFNVQQREREQRIANERAQDEALQGYLDGMSELLTDKEQPLHRAQRGYSLRAMVRARALTVLERLDSGRKGSVLRFLFESELIYKQRTFLDESGLMVTRHNIVSLGDADLRGAYLSGAYLREAYLWRTNLQGANLFGADLSEADLREADLSQADLNGAHLREANLSGANLRRAFLFRADLSRANLREADLSQADLFQADLSGADLSGAFLSGAFLSETFLLMARGWAEEQLSKARTLWGATMPDGQILQGDKVPDGPTVEEWLKSLGKENSDSS